MPLIILSLFVFQAQIYSYKVKIINPLKKSDVITCELHHFNSKFESVLSLRMKLIEHLKEHVPSTVDFNIMKVNNIPKYWLSLLMTSR